MAHVEMGRRNKHNDLNILWESIHCVHLVLTCMHGQVGRIGDISPKDLSIPDTCICTYIYMYVCTCVYVWSVRYSPERTY